MQTYYFIIAFVALGAALLTFFSGFGLGTLLTPIMALFFPIEIAIVLTGIVHLLNNLFKFLLIYKHLNGNVLLKFGIPSILGALIGAFLLSYLTALKIPLYQYFIGQHNCEITLLKIVMATIILFFTVWEVLPQAKKWLFSEQYLTFGGVVSGFFGGLSGNQGALRSAFLKKLSLSKESFIATGIAIACLVDMSRLPVYFGSETKWTTVSDNLILLTITCLFAFCGSYFGNKLLKKTTLVWVQRIVTFALIAIAVAMGIGII